jgi:YD repeat-containing protein
VRSRWWGHLVRVADLFGLLTAATDQWGRHDYPYDAAGQLVSADHPASSGLPDEAYTHDPFGVTSFACYGLGHCAQVVARGTAVRFA